jgi:UDP-N-acetylmuramyl pentapeptide synthase
LARRAWRWPRWKGWPGAARASRSIPAAGGALLIDESYNANPASMRGDAGATGANRPRRIAVLGAMKELGAHGPASTPRWPVRLREAGVDHAILVGPKWRLWPTNWGNRRHRAWQAIAFAHCENTHEAQACLLLRRGARRRDPRQGVEFGGSGPWSRAYCQGTG